MFNQHFLRRDIDEKDIFINGQLYVVKQVNEDMSSFYDPDFIYPESGIVKSELFIKSLSCGNGLHGVSYNCSDISYFRLTDSSNYKFLVIKVDQNKGYVYFEGKIKFKQGEVVCVGTPQDCGRYLNGIRSPHVTIGSNIYTFKDNSTVFCPPFGSINGLCPSLIVGNIETLMSGVKGSIIVGYYYDQSNGGFKFCTGKVGTTLKADTYYHAVNGKLVKADSKLLKKHNL